METERISELSKAYGISMASVNSLANEIKQDIEAAAAQDSAAATQRRADQLRAADAALAAGNTTQAIRMRRQAYGVQTRR